MRSKASLSIDSKASLSLGVVIMFLSAWAVVSAFEWPWKAALFPLAIGIPMFFLAGAEVLWVILGSAHRGETKDFQLSQHLPARVTLRRTASVMAWTLGFFAAIVLLGFQIAVPLLVFLYLKIAGRESWRLSLVFTAVVWAIFYGLFDQLLHLPFPDGWIQTAIGLG